jgi:hypothetical protein
MDIKEQLTKIVSEQLGWPTDPKLLVKNHQLIWQNPRHKAQGGCRLTNEGFDIFVNQIDMKSYEIKFPDDVTITNKITIWLDRFIDGPYYITKKSIVVFKEKTAVQLVLFSGDIKKFGLAKAMSAKETV